MKLNYIHCMDNVAGLQEHIPDNSIDLTVTSPPYDNLRTYNGFSFDFENLAHELYRVTKPGGVVVWVVGDATVKGSETGTSFRQALYFKDEVGFNLHDTMIYGKTNPPPVQHNRYQPCYEYMFVLTKGKPKTFNPLTVSCKHAGRINSHNTFRHQDNKTKQFHGKGRPVKKEKYRENIWSYTVGNTASSSDKIASQHPAIFPEKLAEDHIISWSNPGDIVLDPFMGSGTTAKMAALNGRSFIGFEVSDEYVVIAEKRLKGVV